MGLECYLKIYQTFGCDDSVGIEHPRGFTSFPGDHSDLDPPDSISNSEVKQICADDSVRFPHAKVGHRQGFITEESGSLAAFFILG